MNESDLAKPVADWLRENGYTVYSEVPFYNRCIDMVGVKDKQLRVIELKLRYNRNGIRQAHQCQLATEDVYLAVAKKPLARSVKYAAEAGVGILVVDSKVQIISLPQQKTRVAIYLQRHLLDNCRCSIPSDEAGLPCMSGCGPAQAVAAGVREYVKCHPRANWREIFENVDNHYSNYKSMAGAMTGYVGLSLTALRAKPRTL